MRRCAFDEATSPKRSEPRAPKPPVIDDLIQDRPIRPAPPSRRQWQLLVDLPLASFSLGPLPQPSGGVGLAAGVGYDGWRVLVGGQRWLRQHLTNDDFPGYGADIERASATLRACRALRETAFEIAPCLVLSLEHVSAQGSGMAVTPRTQQATWLGVGAGAQGRLHLADWLRVLVGVDAQIETASPQISIDGVGDLGQLGRAALSVTLGPEWIW